jgi:hypothetical protein
MAGPGRIARHEHGPRVGQPSHGVARYVAVLARTRMPTTYRREPTSPKGADLRERGWFALHNGVPDNAGTGGEASVRPVTACGA